MSLPDTTLSRVPKRQRYTLMQGFLAQAKGDFPEAMRCYLKVAKRDPNDPHALYFAALVQFQQAKYSTLVHRDDVRAEKQRAVNLMWASLKRAPHHPEAWYNLGKFYDDLHEHDMALKCYVAALEQRPDFGQALVSAGNRYWEMGDNAMAEACYRKAQASSEGGPEAVYNLSFMLHFLGDWPACFEAAEARWDCPAYVAEYQRPFTSGPNALPRWHGQPLTGTLLLHGEQGAGDVLQMLRYVPMLRARVPDLALEVFGSFRRLCEASFPGLRVIDRGGDITGCVAHLPTMSLPYVCGTSLDNPPPPAPYLHRPDPSLPPTGKFRVALCWAGSPTHPRDHTRSMPFATLLPLIQRDDVEWVSLQVGPNAQDWQGHGPAPVAEAAGDYLDTAALITSCDLVITVDTSVAHLAGALGAPVWMLVARFPDVRWEQARSDTLWYRTLQIFRQHIAGDWSQVLDIVRQLLDLKIDFKGAGL